VTAGGAEDMKVILLIIVFSLEGGGAVLSTPSSYLSMNDCLSDRDSFYGFYSSDPEFFRDRYGDITKVYTKCVDVFPVIKERMR
jgi:hypothetical protein